MKKFLTFLLILLPIAFISCGDGKDEPTDIQTIKVSITSDLTFKIGGYDFKLKNAGVGSDYLMPINVDAKIYRTGDTEINKIKVPSSPKVNEWNDLNGDQYIGPGQGCVIALLIESNNIQYYAVFHTQSITDSEGNIIGQEFQIKKIK